MEVRKRNGDIVPFDEQRIVNAVTKSMAVGDGVDQKYIRDIICEIESLNEDILDISTIEQVIFNTLSDAGQHNTARAYENFRSVREFQRSVADDIEVQVNELVDGSSDYWNNENSNKNAKIITTQRDYMAGILSTHISKKYLMSPELVQAHNEGIIHQHDMDYMAQNAISNCFSGDTRLVTNYGVRSFDSFNEGDSIKVLDMNGAWKDATVHTYGTQYLNKVTLRANRSVKEITCTANHRWVLHDGTVTTNLSVGDRLYGIQDITEYTPNTFDEKFWFCFGFVLGDGSDITNSTGVRMRLCGGKIKYLSTFIDANYKVSPVNNSDDMIVYDKKQFSKQKFLSDRLWNILPFNLKVALFNGFYSADGCASKNNISTADDNLALMIEEISALAGYHIVNRKEEVRDTPYKIGARLITYSFIVRQLPNRLWKVDKVEPLTKEYPVSDGTIRNNKVKRMVWCVEEPTTHSFTLDGGIITGNCGLINLEDVLQNGTVINGVRIDKPHRLITATTIATQVITAVSSSQYGGVTISLTHLAPFVRSSLQMYRKKYSDRKLSADDVNRFAMEDLQKEIEDSVQTFNYQINSMSTTNGQAPFLSVMMYLDEDPEYTKEIAMLVEEFLKQRIKGMKNSAGAYVTQAFPKLLYVLDENNIGKSSEYHWLTKLAAECTAKRMVPDYISAKIMKRDKGAVYPAMGCRSFLTPDRTKENYAKALNYSNDKPKYYGRLNSGVCTLNLPDIALSSKGDLKTFWGLFEERTEMCHKALKVKLDRLNSATSDVAPILWQDGAYARLPKHTPLTQLLYNGYATISLGYAGLYECVKYMTGESHTKKHGKELGLQIMQALNDKCNQWKSQDNVDYSLYGSPIESTTYKFAKCLKKRFGVIEGITDKDYITNSYHVPVFEEIDPFTKLKLESEFQKLSPGGAISYIECADVTNNTPAVLEVLKYIYDNIMYAELNTKSDYCQACGYNGEIKIIDKNGELTWECPQCGNRDKDTLNVARRTCGYIGSNFWNQGRTQEIKERYVHLDDHVVKP